ncbi:MAG: hypothetical protein ACT4OO_12335 [Nitrospiraceae bacterium]
MLLLVSHVSSLHAADSSNSSPHLFDLRFETTTFVLNLEKQGLQDNSFTNGIGRDTTLIGDFLNFTLHKAWTSKFETEIGVFANIPFGYDTVVSQVRPIVRLSYAPVEQVSATAGTLRVPHRGFLDAVFDDANRYVRPIEQGAQLTTDFDFYRQDAFINWEQAFRGSAPNRFDVGYAGQLRAGVLRFNAQAHWVRNGQALFKLDRSFDTRDNIVTSFGPEVVLEPRRYRLMPDWWNEIGLRLNYLNSYNQPNEVGGDGPAVRGRGYDVMAWLDLDGWRPRIGFWRGTNFISRQGDPEFKVGNFMELGLSKLIRLGDDASLEFGVQVRRMGNFLTGSGFEWVNQEYLVFNWNWDTTRTGFFDDLLTKPSLDASDTPPNSRDGTPVRRFSAKLDSLTYVYNLQFSGVTNINGQPVTNRTFAGEYLSPVLRYTLTTQLKLDAGVFVGLPVGSQQSFHTVQPILSAEWEMLPQVSLVAGTLHRNHPLLDAVFDDALLFSRPIEQGFQFLVNRPSYQQDLFLTWTQVETAMKPERFDVGYAGRVSHSVFGFNGQLYWSHSGGAQFSEARSIIQPGGPRNRPASNNFVAAVGPDLTIRPADYWQELSWFREVEVMALYLTDQNEPTTIADPITRGRGYLLSAGVDLAGWRPYVNFWRGENFISSRGDLAYAAGNFTEFGFLKDVVLPAGFTLRFGGLARTLAGHLIHTEYVLLNWSWDASPWRGYCFRPTLLHLGTAPCGQS